MEVSFIIHYPPTAAGMRQWAKHYSLNAYYSGKSWPLRRKDADYWHSLTHAEMARQKIRRKLFENPVKITMYFNDGLDCSNHAAIFKMIEDALKGRIIKDDSRKWVVGNEMYFHDQNYIRVVVKEV